MSDGHKIATRKLREHTNILDKEIIAAYEQFIEEISNQEILNKKGNKPTKLALRAKELLERFK